jgi:hypothetical protein
VLLVAAATAATSGQGQQQQSRARADWPCGARVDPSYFHLAEGTGGQLLLLAPSEIADSAALLTASDGHPQTIFRLAGTINPGPHEFRVPIDSGVESVVFSISVQCLQTADVEGPDGARVAGDNVTDLSNFRAIRTVIVKQPAPGIWTVRASGSGLAGVVVQARSDLGIAGIAFAAAGRSSSTREPVAGVVNTVRLTLEGRTERVEAAIVNGAFKKLASLVLTPGETDGAYTARFTPGAADFRVLVTGRDGNGFPFQRVNAALFTPTR